MNKTQSTPNRNDTSQTGFRLDKRMLSKLISWICVPLADDVLTSEISKEKNIHEITEASIQFNKYIGTVSHEI